MLQLSTCLLQLSTKTKNLTLTFGISQAEFPLNIRFDQLLKIFLRNILVLIDRSRKDRLKASRTPGIVLLASANPVSKSRRRLAVRGLLHSHSADIVNRVSSELADLLLLLF